MFTVSLRVAFQSSCRYQANILEVAAEESLRLILPPVGSPYINDASPWPMGAAADVSVAVVQLELKLYAGVMLPQLLLVIWVTRNSVPKWMLWLPRVCVTLAKKFW